MTFAIGRARDGTVFIRLGGEKTLRIYRTPEVAHDAMATLGNEVVPPEAKRETLTREAALKAAIHLETLMAAHPAVRGLRNQILSLFRRLA